MSGAAWLHALAFVFCLMAQVGPVLLALLPLHGVQLPA